MMPNKFIIDNFKNLYQALNRDTLSFDELNSVYDNDIVFEDCFHNIKGINDLYSYFDNLYENVSFIGFDFEDQWINDDGAMLTWVMSYKHPRLNSGNLIKVKGASRLMFKDGKICAHRDYFDGGALLYEHIPILKRVIHFLKNRLA